MENSEKKRKAVRELPVHLIALAALIVFFICIADMPNQMENNALALPVAVTLLVFTLVKLFGTVSTIVRLGKDVTQEKTEGKNSVVSIAKSKEFKLLSSVMTFFILLILADRVLNNLLFYVAACIFIFVFPVIVSGKENLKISTWKWAVFSVAMTALIALLFTVLFSINF